MEIITGRQGSGKTTELFNRIRELSKGQRAYIVVPEQYTYIAERALFDKLGCTASADISVTSLMRLAYKISGAKGESLISILNDEAKNLIIRYIIGKKAGELKVFSSVSQRQGFADNTSVIFGEINKNGITAEALKKACEESEEGLLKDKLSDITLLYESYLETIGDKYIDKDVFLDKCASLAAESEIITDSCFFFDSFYSFDKSDYAFITEIIRNSRECLFTLTYDEGEFFTVPAFTLDELKTCAKDAERELTLKHLGDKKNSHPAIKYAQKCLCEYDPAPFEGENDSVFLSEHDDIYSEVRSTAAVICKLIREENYRYCDINLTVSDTNVYKSVIEEVFEEYDIPYFLDSRRKIAFASPVRSLLFLLSAQNSLKTDDILAFAKTGFTGISYEDCCTLENYVREFGIKGHSFFKPFSINNDEELYDLDALNSIREKLVCTFDGFSEITSGAKTIGEYTKALYSYLEQLGFNSDIRATCEKMREAGDFENANIYAQIYNKIISVLESLYDFFSLEPLNTTLVQSMISYALLSCDVGVIPSEIDRVSIGDTLRSRSGDIKAMFILGANEGKLPSAHISASVLTDREKQLAKNVGIDFISTSSYRNAKENFVIYTLISKPEEKLFISCCALGGDEEEAAPCEIFEKLKAAFPSSSYATSLTERMCTVRSAFSLLSVNLSERKYSSDRDIKNDAIFDCYNAFFSDNEALKPYALIAQSGLNFENDAKIYDKKAYEKLISTPLNTSVSRLERYAQCPFSYFAQYVLGLKERREYIIGRADAGNVLHKVVECFSREILDGKRDIAKLSEEDITKSAFSLCDEIIKDYKGRIYQNIASSAYLMMRLKKNSANALCEIVRQMQLSDFLMSEAEARFELGADYAPICLTTDEGTVYLRGKIDRVDTCDIGGNKYVKIIDYKSGATTLDITKIYFGLSLQLPAYISAITAQSSAKPAGIFYLHLSAHDVDVKKSEELFSVTQKVQKQFGLSGVFLSDLEVIKAMDNYCDGGSFIEGLKLKDGKVSANDSAVGEEGFELLINKTNENIKKLSEKVISAQIPISPYLYKTQKPCDWCAYKGVCKFSTDFGANRYNYIRTLKDKNINAGFGNETEAQND